ncbi:unnamed protein product [Rotaria socialis]|uniref:B30.2/SPRY domain-containing protein n=1 Tax=Rotaria socialis TaxID=392032 RepID=A0A817TSW1_9BILA|nr:unnamed protein product [Rotaria socialis]CAF3316095.1 unnamed protein product [Rotaria socialis]CAF3370284.1 unnamed protein product [Rotaria socialis]CAF3637174.1 unnamed protein product [Rotaria socialis]
MATAAESNLCSVCTKPLGKYFCTGCKKYFCPKDFKEHEQQLSIKFDNEVVRSHDELLVQIQKLEKANHFSSDLFIQIEQWKKTTINKVEKAAERARHELGELIDKQRMTITKQLEPIAKEIRSRREEECFVENDIDRLRKKIGDIQRTVEQLNRKDTTKSIIFDNDQIDWNRIIYIRDEQQYSDNTFGSIHGSLNLSDNKRVVTKTGNDEHATCRCTSLFDCGTHTLRFALEQHGASLFFFFGVLSSTAPQTAPYQTAKSVYGWQVWTQNGVVLDGSTQKGFGGYTCKYQKGDIISCVIDCDKRKIRHTNERTKNTFELDVDVGKCALPWQLLFELYYPNDCVRLL